MFSTVYDCMLGSVTDRLCETVIIGKKSSINNPSLFSIWKCTETHLAACWNPAAALIITWLFYKAETQKTTSYYQVARIWYFECHQRRSLGPKCTKIVGGRGSAPDPAEGAHDVPPDPSTAGEEASPLPRLLHPRRLRRLNSRAFGASILASDKCPSKQNRGYATEWVVMGSGSFYLCLWRQNY